MRTNFAKIFIVVFISVMAVSCSSTVVVGSKHKHKSEKPLPPGQAKKITGEKSAKNHAPGQNKRK